MNIFRSMVVAGMVSIVGQAASGVMVVQAQAPVVNQNYIVVLNDSVTNVPAAASAMASQYGMAVSHRYSAALKGFAAAMPEARVAALKSDARVKLISIDGEVSIDAPRADKPGKGKPTPTPTPAPVQSLPSGVDRVDAELATGAGAGATVAVIDTGVDLDHPDLQPNIVGQKTCVARTNDADDDNGHGSHVAGTVAAANNDYGVVGVAPEAKLVAVKVLNSRGSGRWSDIICGIDWVTANASTLNISVANMSLSGSGSSDDNCGLTNADALHQAICNSTAAGVTYVVAAGNDGTNASTRVPAAYNDTVITVSALADSDGVAGGLGGAVSGYTDDTFAGFSNYGAVVDIGAPGVNITSTYKNGGYASISGTSMASPHVAAAVALYQMANPGATWTQSLAGLLQGAELLNQGHSDPSGLHSEPVLQVDTL